MMTSNKTTFTFNGPMIADLVTGTDDKGQPQLLLRLHSEKTGSVEVLIEAPAIIIDHSGMKSGNRITVNG